MESPAPNVHAYAIADAISVRAFLSGLSDEVIKADKTQALLRLKEGSYAMVHDFGVVVFFNTTTEAQKPLLARLNSMSGPQPHAPLVEDFSIVVAPGERTAAGFDKLVVGELTVPIVELVGLVVGQSAAMEYYEDDVDRILGRLDVLADEVAEGGGFRGSVRTLNRFIGEGLRLRNRVIFTLALLDSPVSTWDDEVLDRLHRELRSSFGIEDRYRALDHKLAMIRDSLQIIGDLTRHKRSMLLEAGVAILIALEIVLFLVK